MSASLVVAVVLLIVIGGLLLWYLVKIIRGCREVSMARKLKKDSQAIKGEIGDVDILSKAYGRGHMTYGKVDVAYQFNEQSYRMTQTVSKDLAMHFLRGQKATKVLCLPEQSQRARLAQARADYVNIQGLSLGITLPGMLVGGMIAVAAMVVFYINRTVAINWLDQWLDRTQLWQMEFWLNDSRNSIFLGPIVFFMVFVLFAFLPCWLVDKLIMKRFLYEEKTFEED